MAYIDAIGELDGNPCVCSIGRPRRARYPEEPEGLLALDPQLICYSWISGISDVAVVAFVRKNQFLRFSISRPRFTKNSARNIGQLVEATVAQIEAGQFASHSGIRFPQNGCVSCAHLGLCLDNQPLVDANSSAVPERLTLIGLTILTTNGRPLVAPKLNRRRALFVLTKIDEILAWEKATDRERDSRFVDLGRYLCEVRCGAVLAARQL